MNRTVNPYVSEVAEVPAGIPARMTLSERSRM
jgi:hypothetical protein